MHACTPAPRTPGAAQATCACPPASCAQEIKLTEDHKSYELVQRCRVHFEVKHGARGAFLPVRLPVQLPTGQGSTCTAVRAACERLLACLPCRAAPVVWLQRTRALRGCTTTRMSMATSS